MAYTLQQLADLDSAISSGVTSTSYEGKSVQFRSLDEMLRLRNIIALSLGVTPQRSSTLLVSHGRGYGDTNWSSDDEIFGA